MPDRYRINHRCVRLLVKTTQITTSKSEALGQDESSIGYASDGGAIVGAVVVGLVGRHIRWLVFLLVRSVRVIFLNVHSQSLGVDVPVTNEEHCAEHGLRH